MAIPQKVAFGAQLATTQPRTTGFSRVANLGIRAPEAFRTKVCNLQRKTLKGGVQSRRQVRAAAGGICVYAAAAETTDKSLRELNQDDYYPFLEGVGDRLVVVDFYTDWCGPCKVMLPLLEELAQELKDKVDIVKFNCNARNKELGKKLNVRVAPTFHIYKNSNKVAEMTGAKIDELKSLINENL